MAGERGIIKFCHYQIQAKSSFALPKFALNCLTNPLIFFSLLLFWFTDGCWGSSQGRSTDSNSSFFAPSSVWPGSTDAICMNGLGIISRESIISFYKGKLGTCTIPIIQELRLLLETYSHPEHPFYSPAATSTTAGNTRTQKLPLTNSKKLAKKLASSALPPRACDGRHLLRWATPEFRCGLFKKSAATAT